MELVKHTGWDVASLSDYKASLLEDVYIKKEVPESIQADLRVVEKLMLHTYYEYDFIDIALTQGVFIFEKAMRIYYRELGHTKKLTLEKLINWFFNNGYFETDHVSEIHSLRDIRNKRVHDTDRHEKGFLYLKTVYTIVDLINDLYEDRQLRVERKEIVLKTQLELCELYKNGCLFELSGKKYIGYQAIAVFLNNKTGLHDLSLNLWLIHDPKAISFKNGFADNCLKATISNWRLENKVFTGTLKEDGSLFRITPIDEKNMQKYQAWWQEWRAVPSWPLDWFLTTDKIGHVNHLREFYKIYP